MFSTAGKASRSQNGHWVRVCQSQNIVSWQRISVTTCTGVMFTSTRTPGGSQKGQRDVGRALANKLSTTNSAWQPDVWKEKEI